MTKSAAMDVFLSSTEARASSKDGDDKVHFGLKTTNPMSV